MIIIYKPLITEQTMKMAAARQYTFLVNKQAKKEVIKKEAARLFSVDVTAIKTINYSSLERPQRSRKGHYHQKAFKKAIISVREGQRIALFEEASEVAEEVAVTNAEGEILTTVKEKKSLLKGTKVKIEKSSKKQETAKKISKDPKKGDK